MPDSAARDRGGMLDPADLIGGFFRVHFNLRTTQWSVASLAGPRKGRVVANVDDITLTGVRLIVSESGLRRVKRDGRRAVHAWVHGTVIAVNARSGVDGLTRISYNPKPKNPQDFDPYFRVQTASGAGRIVTEADWLLLAKPTVGAPKGYGWLRHP